MREFNKQVVYFFDIFLKDFLSPSSQYSFLFPLRSTGVPANWYWSTDYTVLQYQLHGTTYAVKCLFACHYVEEKLHLGGRNNYM